MGDFLSTSLPLVASLVCYAYLLFRLRRQDRAFPFADVGVVFATFVLLYTVVPLVSIILLGGNYNWLTDYRLRAYAPSLDESVFLAWHFVVFLGGFVFTYSSVRRGQIRFDISGSTVRRFAPVIVFVTAAVSVYFVALEYVTGIETSNLYGDTSRANAEAYQSLPLLLRQVSGHLHGILFVFKIALVAIVARNWRKHGWRLMGVCWLGYELLIPFIELGSRAGSLFVLAVFVLCYHKMVKPVPFGLMLLGVLSLFCAYMIQGAIRTGGNLGELGVITAAMSSNEFLSVFSTAYDLQMRVREGSLEIPLQVYFADFLRLVPQQILPFEKVDPSIWYLDLLGLKDSGVGLAFGVVSEGVIGFGLPDVLLRGAVVGWTVGCIHNAARKRAFHFGWVVFYLWLCTRVYLLCRNSTFYWVGLVFYQCLPALAVLYYFSRVVRGKSDRSVRAYLGAGEQRARY